MILSYRMIVEGVPKPNGVVGGSIPSRETVSLLDGKLARWSSASRVLKITSTCSGSV